MSAQNNRHNDSELPNLRYSALEEYWIGNLSNRIEILIAGSDVEPNPVFLELARQVLPLISDLRSEAQWYLGAFTLAELATGAADIDSLELGIDRTLPNEFEAVFNIASDVYGKWRVRFRLDSQGIARPVGFSRRNC